MIDAKKREKPLWSPPMCSDSNEVRKSATVAVQRYVIVLAAVMHFEFVVRFIIAPCAGNQVDEIVDAVFDKPDFQPAQTAVIGNSAVSIADFAFRHSNTS